MSIKNRAAVVACGLALAATVFALVTAFAAETNTGNTGSTEVTVIAEKGTEPGHTDEDQLAFEVPTKIAFAAKADGTLVGPSASATQIVNKSVFGIHVTKIDVTAANSWKLVSDTTTDAENNEIAFTLNGEQARPNADVSRDTKWNMAYSGAAGDKIDIETAGNVTRATNDLSTAQKAATITWTLAAGNAQ